MTSLSRYATDLRRTKTARPPGKRADRLREGDRISIYCPYLRTQVWAAVVETQVFWSNFLPWGSLGIRPKKRKLVRVVTRSNGDRVVCPLHVFEVQEKQEKTTEVVRLGRPQPEVFAGKSIS